MLITILFFLCCPSSPPIVQFSLNGHHQQGTSIGRDVVAGRGLEGTLLLEGDWKGRCCWKGIGRDVDWKGRQFEELEGTSIGRVGRDVDCKGRRMERIDPNVVAGRGLKGLDVVYCSDRRCCCCCTLLKDNSDWTLLEDNSD